MPAWVRSDDKVEHDRAPRKKGARWPVQLERKEEEARVVSAWLCRRRMKERLKIPAE